MLKKHDFASEGYEQRKEYDDFWAWLEAAISELIEFNRESRVITKSKTICSFIE